VRAHEGAANETVYLNNAANLLQNGRCYLFSFEVVSGCSLDTRADTCQSQTDAVLHLTVDYVALEGGKATKVEAKPPPPPDSGSGSGAGNTGSAGPSSHGPSSNGTGNGASGNTGSGGNSSPSGNGSSPPATTLSYNARDLELWSRYANQLLLADHPHRIITHLFLHRNLKNKKNLDKVFNNIHVHNDLSAMIDVRTLKTRYVEHTADWFYRPKSADRAARAGNKRSFSPSLFNKMKS
jgi:hypothetical protein